MADIVEQIKLEVDTSGLNKAITAVERLEEQANSLRGTFKDVFGDIEKASASLNALKTPSFKDTGLDKVSRDSEEAARTAKGHASAERERQREMQKTQEVAKKSRQFGDNPALRTAPSVANTRLGPPQEGVNRNMPHKMAMAEDARLSRERVKNEMALAREAAKAAQQIERQVTANERAAAATNKKLQRETEANSKRFGQNLLTQGSVDPQALQEGQRALASHQRGLQIASRSSNEYYAASNQLTTQLNAMSKAQEKANNSLSNTRYALYDVAASLAGVTLVASAMSVAPTKVAMEFESAFAQVIRTADLTGEAVQRTYNDLVNLSTTTPMSFESLAEVGALGGQLGIASDDIATFTSVVSRLSETSDLTTEAAGEMLGRFQAINDVGADKYENLASAVLKVGVNSMAAESDIANVAIQISSMANLAGYTADQIVGLAGGMASLAVPPELSRSVITQVFSNIDKAVTDNGEALQKWSALAGVSAQEFKEAWNTENFAPLFNKALVNLALEGENGRAVLQDLGITSRTVVPSLLRMAQGVEVMNSTMADASSGWAEGTTLQEQYGVIAETTAAKLKMLRNQVTALGAAFGSGSNFLLSGLIEGATGILRIFEAIIKNPIGGALSTAAVALGATAAATSSWLSIKALVIASSYALRTAMAGENHLAGTMRGAFMDLARSFEYLNVNTNKSTASMGADTAAKTANTQATTTLSTANRGLATAVATTVASTTALNTATATSVASTGRLASAWNTTTSALGRAGSVLKSVSGFINLPMALFTGASMVIGKLYNDYAMNRQVAVDQSKTLANAIMADTRAAEQGEQAALMLAKAWDEAGNSYTTAIHATDGKITSDQLLAQAQDGLKQKIGETNAELESQIFYLGEASKEAVAALFSTDEVVNAGNSLKAAWTDSLASSSGMDFETMFKGLVLGGAEAEAIIQQLRTSSIALSDDFQILALNWPLASDFLSFDTFEAAKGTFSGLSDETYALVEALYELPIAEREDAFNDLMAAVDNQSRAFGGAMAAAEGFAGIVGPAMDELSASADYSYWAAEALGLVEEGADHASGAVGNLGLNSLEASINTLNAMYAMGESLVANGLNFDYLSQSGRANMSALMQVAQVAANASGGNATAMAQHAMSIMQSLVNAGVAAADAVLAVNSVVGAVATNAGIPWQNISMPQFQAFTAGAAGASAMAQNYNRALFEGLSAGRASAAGSRRAGDGAKKAGKNARNAAKDTKKMSKEVRTLTDYTNDLAKVFKSANEIRWGHSKAIDDTASALKDMRDWAEKAAERIADAKDEMDDAKKSIRDARDELQEINAELSKLYADRDVLEFQYKVAVEYGDTLRAGQIKADLDTNASDIKSKTSDRDDANADINTGNADLAKATKELSQAQKDAKRDLTGTTESAREQRNMVWDLIDSYQDQLVEYANTGASQDQVRAKAVKLRGEFERHLTQMGYNRTEVRRYSQSFSDMTAVINRLPKNITVKADPNPAIRALREFQSSSKKSTDAVNKNLNGVRDNVGKLGGSVGKLGGSLGGLKVPNLNFPADQPKNFKWHVDRLSDSLYRVRDGFISVKKAGKDTKMYVPGVAYRAGTYGSLLAKGGLVPGGPGANMIDFSPHGTDTVPAMLTPGEFVITRSATQALGVPFLNALNKATPGSPVSNTVMASANSGRPSVQLVELMPHQMGQIVTAVSNNVTRTMSGGDLSFAMTNANARSERAGVN